MPDVNRSANIKTDVIYQIIIDRFFDGDPANNDPDKSFGLYDSTKSKWKMYWGGDLEGVRLKIPYLKSLGITAIWLSPVLDNVDKVATENNTGYHGYWTRDFKRIEEHFGDWTTFDRLVEEAHENGLKIIVDFVPNHSNPIMETNPAFAEAAAFYDDGVYMGNYFDDEGKSYFHHNGEVRNWDDRYQSQYSNFLDPEKFSLGDFNHENELIVCYLTDAAKQLLDHGVDGLRLDALKHFNVGFSRALANHLVQHCNVSLIGEWFYDGPGNPAHGEKVRFANQSGINLLDFDLNLAIRSVFGTRTANMYDLDAMLNTTQAEYIYKENLVTFIDNHDLARFLSVNANKRDLELALAFILTQRGTPSIYYGTEQYASGGEDPYNRPMMPGFDTTTKAFQLISTLAPLRQQNAAVPYGLSTARYISSDVYVYERKFYDDLLLVAIHRGSSPVTIPCLYTQLPSGVYSDQLAGLLNGKTVQVADGCIHNFTLESGSVAVYSYTAEAWAPQLGSAAPHFGVAGNRVNMDGKGFGSVAGKVKFGDEEAAIINWTASSIDVVVPEVESGAVEIRVISQGETSNPYLFNVLSGKQTAAKFVVRNVPPTVYGDEVYMTGNVPELGNWSTDTGFSIINAQGPFLAPYYPDWFQIVSIPIGQEIQFKFFIKRANGYIEWEPGNNHTVTAADLGTHECIVTWGAG